MEKLLSSSKLLTIVVSLLLIFACTISNSTFETINKGHLEKLDFDIHALDKDGLIGPPTGKVSVDYQFCIPKGEKYLDAILAIDPDLKQMRKYIGREGCREEHLAFIGSTHKPMHKEILRRLSALEYIEKIERIWWL